MLRPLSRLAVVAAVALPVAVFFACGTSAVGVDTCQQIEAARCARAEQCGLSLAQPLHRDPDVEACVRYYDIACLHGLEIAADPGTAAVQACLSAIQATPIDCETVLHPETSPACAWLIPPAVDAGIDAPDATDAADGAADVE